RVDGRGVAATTSARGRRQSRGRRRGRPAPRPTPDTRSPPRRYARIGRLATPRIKSADLQRGCLGDCHRGTTRGNPAQGSFPNTGPGDRTRARAPGGTSPCPPHATSLRKPPPPRTPAPFALFLARLRPPDAR